MEPNTIAVVGSANVDRLVRVPTLPRPGETIVGAEPVHAPGGKGANQAVAAALQGSTVAMVAALGDDDDAQLIITSMTRAGVSMEHSLAVPHATGSAIVLVDDDSENLIVVSRGANSALDPRLVTEAIHSVRPTLLGLSLEIPHEAVLAAARAARDVHARVVLNLSPAASLPSDLVGLCDVVVVNEHEARELLGVRSDSSDTDAIERVRAVGIACAVITLGDRGALVVSVETSEVSRVAPFVVTAVDTTGCGDAFMGGLMSQMNDGREVVDACRYATVVAALAATSMGAQPSYPSRARVRAAIAEIR